MSARRATRCASSSLRAPSSISRIVGCRTTQILGEVNKVLRRRHHRLTRQRIPYSAGCIGVAIAAPRWRSGGGWGGGGMGQDPRPSARSSPTAMPSNGSVDNEIDIRSCAAFHPSRAPIRRAVGCRSPPKPPSQADRLGGASAGWSSLPCNPWRHGHYRTFRSSAGMRDAHPPRRLGTARGATHGDRAQILGSNLR